jgi:hypothetical protein
MQGREDDQKKKRARKRREREPGGKRRQMQKGEVEHPLPSPANPQLTLNRIISA